MDFLIFIATFLIIFVPGYIFLEWQNEKEIERIYKKHSLKTSDDK